MSFGALGEIWREIWRWSCLEDLAQHCWRGALFTPFIALMVQSADQRPIHHSPIWPPSLFPPRSPFLILLFLLFSLHLFIKLMRLKLGPSSQEGVTEGKGGHKQAGKESSSLFVHTGELLHVLGGLSLSQNKHFTHTHTRCDTASEECDIRTCMWRGVSLRPQCSVIQHRPVLWNGYSLAHYAVLFVRVCCIDMLPPTLRHWFCQSGSNREGFCLCRLSILLFWGCCSNKTAIFNISSHDPPE